MAIRILFWNIKKNAFFDVISNVVEEAEADIVAFAEFPEENNDITECEKKLQNIDSRFEYLKPYSEVKVQLFYKNFLRISNATDLTPRITAKRILAEDIELLLFFCHLEDKFFHDSTQQPFLIQPHVKDILDYEIDSGNSNILICGDFNMNPFEQGMALNTGFNAMMDKNLVQIRKSRTVQGKKFDFFYNPMWTLFGKDVGAGTAPGTYFYNEGEPVTQYWHILDQVIMRPSVVPYFDLPSLKILAKGKRYNLLDSHNVVDKNKFSDHLPILFQLNLKP